MTNDERQALREKHSKHPKHDACQICGIYTKHEPVWPCDVIKVLDELEGLLEHVNWKAYGKATSIPEIDESL